MADPTIADAVDAALDAYAEQTALAEDVDDEWSYIQDLSEAWRARLDEVLAARGGDPAGPSVVAAIDAASTEIGSIEDPHRAIDWLSTFPQVVLLAVGETP